jgi:hypothetical protein
MSHLVVQLYCDPTELCRDDVDPAFTRLQLVIELTDRLACALVAFVARSISLW